MCAAKKGNKYAEGNEGGRPAMFKTPSELQKKIDDYFETEKTITICGLAYFLGFSSRQSLIDYEKKEEFTDIIKRAKLRVEMSYEQLLHESSCTGAIFALKNMDWHDKSEVAVSGVSLHFDKDDEKA